MDFSDVNGLKISLRPFIGMVVSNLKLIITPTDGSLLDSNVSLSLTFSERNKILTVDTTGGQLPVLSEEYWEVDFIGRDSLYSEMTRWKANEYHKQENLRNQICFDLTEDTHVHGQKITSIEIVVIAPEKIPTGLKINLSNGEEIWTGPSNSGLNSVYITNCSFINSNLSYPPPYVFEVKFIKVDS